MGLLALSLEAQAITGLDSTLGSNRDAADCSENPYSDIPEGGRKERDRAALGDQSKSEVAFFERFSGPLIQWHAGKRRQPGRAVRWILAPACSLPPEPPTSRFLSMRLSTAAVLIDGSAYVTSRSRKPCPTNERNAKHGTPYTRPYFPRAVSSN